VLCYRANESILQVIEPLHEDLTRAGVDFELLLVANYWPEQADRTPQVVADFAAGRAGVRTVTRAKAGGMGWDMRAGFQAARGAYMVVIDGDEQNPVEDVLGMYKEMSRRRLDVMKGRRIARLDGSYRHLVSVVYNALFRILFRTSGIWDINGKPKGLSRSAYERIALRSDDWFVDAEIVLEARREGLRLAELPVIFRKNKTRPSFVRPAAIREFIVNMLLYRYRYGRRG
jgi:glycosyltransferase involved in cell wall biosynthesis